jgi:putative ubiquitin-RnfH superfamily antitoxin RatB of RatAB toxin-antitoxin module
MTDKVMSIEVVYALPEKQVLLEVAIHEGATVADAISLSGIASHFPDEDMAKAKLGIWNKVVKPSAELRDGDRIEIYRPLIADPKEVRKRRAEKAVEEGRADKVTGGRPNRLRSKE